MRATTWVWVWSWSWALLVEGWSATRWRNGREGHGHVDAAAVVRLRVGDAERDDAVGAIDAGDADLDGAGVAGGQLEAEVGDVGGEALEVHRLAAVERDQRLDRRRARANAVHRDDDERARAAAAAAQRQRRHDQNPWQRTTDRA